MFYTLIEMFVYNLMLPFHKIWDITNFSEAHFFAYLCRSVSGVFFEYARQMRAVDETGSGGDLRDGQVSVPQEFTDYFNTLMYPVVSRSVSGFLFEKVHETRFG